MPRLLPRLLKWLERNPPSQPDFRGPLVKHRRKIKSLWKPIPSANELNGSFLYNDRLHESFLLEGDEIVVKQNLFTRHKSLPPVVKLQKNQEGLAIGRDFPREMTEQEKQWWSSPYLRMLSSPERRCICTERRLPTDFLIRLIAVQMSVKKNPGVSTALVPNGILHPKFSSRQRRLVYYVTCWKEALRETLARGSYKRPIHNINVHSLLEAQISGQLRVRVLQELELLALRLKAAPGMLSEDVAIRRLTRSEWTTMKSTGQVPWEGAACVLIVPPVKRDPVTKQRPQPKYEDLPPEVTGNNDETTRPLPPLPPLSILHPTQDPTYEEPLEFLRDAHLPDSRVPVYNGLSLFPDRSQRWALHRRLCEVLDIESKARDKWKKRSDGRLRGEKPSHAFIVFSSGKTVVRADTVPLAIALWRIRMWEGAGWGDCDWFTQRPSQSDAA